MHPGLVTSSTSEQEWLRVTHLDLEHRSVAVHGLLDLAGTLIEGLGGSGIRELAGRRLSETLCTRTACE